MRWIVRAVAAAGLGNAQPAPKRVALVIGNGAYQVSARRLANPPRDAALIAAKLRGLGFDVDSVSDATRASMEGAFERFGAKLKAGGPDAVGLFYYAGHGAQRDGVNFLVPVDANAATADRLRYQSPPMQFLLDDMAEAGNAVNIIILDACRDMPLPDGSRAIGRGGLADVGRLPNVFIAYATAPGRTAADGGGANSPFTTILAAALDTQAGEPIELLFSDVNARVYSATGGGQAPEYRAGLVRAPRWSFAAARPGAADPELARLRRENEALRKAGAAARPVPPASAGTPVSAVTNRPAEAGGTMRPGQPFRDCADCPEMVTIPAGRFTMGDNASDQAGERPAHTVSVPAFAAGRYEVTLGEWKAFVAATGRATPAVNSSAGTYCAWNSPGYTQDDRHPVACVSWQDAQAYALWLSQKTGRTYRLLTEAEWEYAARAGTSTAYWFGGSVSPRNANYSDSGNAATVRVGGYGANGFGLHDVHGNVWEWVEDCFAPTYSGLATDGSANTTQDCSTRVIRGGSWVDAATDLRSASRIGNTPTLRFNLVGFRLARTL